MTKIRKTPNRSYLDKWARLTALVSKSEQLKLSEICRVHGGKPGTIATNLARISATVAPEEFHLFWRAVKKAAEKHSRAKLLASQGEQNAAV